MIVIQIHKIPFSKFAFTLKNILGLFNIKESPQHSFFFNRIMFINSKVLITSKTQKTVMSLNTQVV